MTYQCVKMPKIGQIRPLIRSVCVLIDRSLFIHYYYYTIITLTHILFAIIIFLLHTIMSAHSTTTILTYYIQYYKKKSEGQNQPTFLPNIFSYYSQCERMDGDPNVSALLRSFSCSSVTSMVEFRGKDSNGSTVKPCSTPSLYPGKTQLRSKQIEVSVTYCGVILESKVVQKLSLEKKVFNK